MGMHLFESVPSFADEHGSGEDFPPMQLIVAIKEHNQGKINSHWWYFEGIANLMKPEYCFLLDVGTRPRRSSFYVFMRQFRKQPTLAGVSVHDPDRAFSIDLIGLVVGAHFEYKIASVLDKSFESSLGYLSVLPGAFSAYRYEALLGQPLQAYFRQLFVADADLDPFTTNMMLAEDRVLCYELVAKKGCGYTLGYLNSAVAETDVPTDIGRLLKQRRRWLNGSFFALLYTLLHYSDFQRQTTHKFLRKLAITFEYFFYCVVVIVQWLAVGLFLLITRFLLETMGQPWLVYDGATVLFAVLIVFQFLMAFWNDPVRLSLMYYCSAILFGVYFIAMVALSIQYSVDQIRAGSPLLLATLFLTWGMYVVLAVLHGELVTLLTAIIGYVFMMPTFLVIMPIFAFTNVHDVSWGTKDLDSAAFGDANANEKVKERVRRRFNMFRITLLLFWIGSNVVLAGAAIYFNLFNVVLIFVLVMLLFLNGSRFFGSVAYLTSSQASPSLIVKVAFAPVRLVVLVSVVKLPVAVIVSAFGLILSLLGMIAPRAVTDPILVALARFDLWFTHVGTSGSMPCMRADPEARSYFGLFRWGVTALGTGIVLGALVAFKYWWPMAHGYLQYVAIVALVLVACNAVYMVDYVSRYIARRTLATR
ncbi:hypothetical protein PBRA_002119 [Plasmodiophora brassicae]|uniref:chitin synthase n=1 Tax=Plasmodiophora brassicae TaxID=37360 RepID=A0A0G4J1J4_PLABS|nr:hypothetical protein PBRA_002119 [Plasmodiophora brassicae]